MKDFEEMQKQIDERSRKDRLKRLTELGVIGIDTTNRTFQLSSRGSEFTEEAARSYMNGLFRSCIFCCSCAVEQEFKHILILTSENKDKEYRRLSSEKFPFGKIIEQARQNEKLKSFIKDAEWIKEVRNKIAVHPLYIQVLSYPLYIDWNKSKDLMEELMWKNNTVKTDLKKLLSFLSEEERKELESQEIEYDLPEKHKIKIVELLNEPEKGFYLNYFTMREILLQHLALESYKKMGKILEGLYSVNV